MPRLAYDSRAWWEAFAPFAAPAFLAKHFPASQGGLSRPGWQSAIDRARAAYPELPWHQGQRGYHFTPPGPCPAPIYDEGTVVVVQEQEPLTTAEKVERDREVQRLREQLTEQNKRYNAALREQNAFEKLAEDGRQALQPLSPITPAPKKHEPVRATQALVATWADWHCDAIVDYEIMEGLNWYDPPTFLRRVECCVDKTLLIANLHPTIDYHVLHINDVGDNIENTIHEEAKTTNSMPPLKAVRFCAETKARAIRDLASNFERVVYHAVPGNHARTQKKVPWGLPTENYDWLIYQWTKSLCADLPNVEFDIPAAWSHTFEIEGWGWFLNHGTTDAKGGFGGISWYSLVKSDTKRTAMDVKLKRTVLAREYGHMHQEANVERAGGNGMVLLNPSLMGGNHYAKEGMAGTYSEPAQMLRSVHATEGLVASYRLNVRQYEANSSGRYDSLLDLV